MPTRSIARGVCVPLAAADAASCRAAAHTVSEDSHNEKIQRSRTSLCVPVPHELRCSLQEVGRQIATK